LRQETRPAANIEHSFARLDCEILDEHLTGNELPSCADLIVIACQTLVIERQ
jgi:hypothetical protein